MKTNKRILPDYSGGLNIFVDPKGDIYPCDVSSEKIGNIMETKSPIGDLVSNNSACEKSWMICTARQAIKKHWVKAGFWIVKNKMKNV